MSIWLDWSIFLESVAALAQSASEEPQAKDLGNRRRRAAMDRWPARGNVLGRWGAELAHGEVSAVVTYSDYGCTGQRVAQLKGPIVAISGRLCQQKLGRQTIGNPIAWWL